ncbi:cellulose biosynthesis protein BcsN [Methylobacterium oryzisoli]|uniref:cellulose biosynthesis protein BcsN n=1 Tax=Methylobacterium oryzisoli TaxID=3385502 RepID=UPI0038922E44
MISRHSRIAALAARLLGLAVAAASLAACTTAGTGHRSVQALESRGSFASLAGTARSRSLVSMPGAETARSIQADDRPQGLHQRITFGGPGDGGWIDLTVGQQGAGGGSGPTKPTRAGIASELAALAPRSLYRVSSRPVNNAYGPVGIALAERCVYAWQWIDPVPSLAADLPVPGARLAASIRVHRCGAATGDMEAIIGGLERLRLGTAGSSVLRPLRRRPAPQTRPAGQDVAASSPRPDQPAPVAAVRPVPQPAAGGAATYLAPPAPVPPAVSAGTLVVPRPGPAGSGTLTEPRFLTGPVLSAGAGRAGGPPPMPVQQPAVQTEPVSGALPAQAYRGPTPPPFGW